MGHTAARPAPESDGHSAVFVGGPTYSDNKDAAQVIADLRGSGFGTVILWSIHVALEDKKDGQTKDEMTKDGDLFYNNVRIISEGEYCADEDWLPLLKELRTRQPSSIERVEVSVGSAPPATDWENIATLIDKYGTGPSSVLRRNFSKLREITGADAINNDDESCYDLDSTVKFAKMADEIGYRFTIVPYDDETHWGKLKKRLGPIMDRAYVQCYAGGSDNADAGILGTWSEELGGMPVIPGLWCRHATSEGGSCDSGDSPEEMKQQLSAWCRKSDKISGGFLWLYDDVKKCARETGYTTAKYAQAINEATRTRKPAATTV